MLFEIPSISKLLTHEVFGPVLHVVRWPLEKLDDVIDQINSTGYGLTFGIHSRIDERIRDVCARVQAGNIYVNRSMTGAARGRSSPLAGMACPALDPRRAGRITCRASAASARSA